MAYAVVLRTHGTEIAYSLGLAIARTGGSRKATMLELVELLEHGIVGNKALGNFVPEGGI